MDTKIQEKKEELQRLKENFTSDIPVKEYIQLHISKLHEYNETKDIGQMLLGLLAERNGTTVSEYYKKYGLEFED